MPFEVWVAIGLATVIVALLLVSPVARAVASSAVRRPLVTSYITIDERGKVNVADDNSSSGTRPPAAGAMG